MSSKLYNLGQHDFVKGAITAIFAAVVATLYGIVSQGDFNVFATDWGMVLNDVIKVSSTAFIAYLMKNFATDEDGKIAGL